VCTSYDGCFIDAPLENMDLSRGYGILLIKLSLGFSENPFIERDNTATHRFNYRNLFTLYMAYGP
jgi:hypothetical protein